MSYQDGMAAINLEMPDKVPRTEYSASGHWKLVEKVTGIPVNSKSSPEVQQKASLAFEKEWDYGFIWNILVATQPLEPCRTKMGHAVYAADGTYTQFVDDVAACGVNGFVMEPTTDMAYVAERYGKTHSFIGNADTRILLLGSKEDIYNEVKRCMDIGKKCPGFFMAVGNHIPANTPVENALYYNEVFEKLRRR